MHKSQIPLLALLAVLLAAVGAQAQTPCDGTPSSTLFVLPPDSLGPKLLMSVRGVDAATMASYTLRLYQATAAGAIQGPALSTQNVTAAATSSLGVLQSDPLTVCIALPVIPVAQIPRGVPLVASIVATGGVPTLASVESAPSNPFGQRIVAPSIRVSP